MTTAQIIYGILLFVFGTFTGIIAYFAKRQIDSMEKRMDSHSKRINTLEQAQITHATTSVKIEYIEKSVTEMKEDFKQFAENFNEIKSAILNRK